MYKLKKEKAQIMLVDILFSIVIIILMFFLLTKWVEINIYNTSSNKDNLELNNISLLIYNKLTSNYKINVLAVDSNNSFLIPDSFSKDSEITKANLGLPTDFNCTFTVQGVNFTTNECVDTPPTIGSYFQLDFNAIVYSSATIRKSDYTNNLSGSSTPLIKSAKLVVWRDIKWEKDLLFQ